MTNLTISSTSTGEHCTPYWKHSICGDRAGLALRSQYRDGLATAVRECGFGNLRQHGMFHDDMYLWHERSAPFNFQYLFSNYDYYLSIGIKPFVELSFIPTWMASNDNRIFVAKCAACPPNNYDDWHQMVQATTRALVDRYGIDEVRSWNFEVWNEPDIIFWKGTQAEYFELHMRSVEAVKSVDASLRIGGPATSNFVMNAEGEYSPVWVEDFMQFCVANNLPADFISTHPYPTDFPFDDASGTHRRVVRDRGATTRDLKLLRKVVDASPFAGVPIHCNEWGSSPSPRDHCHDHPFSASFLLENILGNLGTVDSLAKWVFSDVSEEAAPGAAEFHGGWGLLTVNGIRKPGFHAYAFLNKVGETLLYNGDGCAVFRSARGWQTLLFNHHHYTNTDAAWDTAKGAAEMIGAGEPRRFELTLTHLPSRVRVTRSLVDEEHGWAKKTWQEMGAPEWPLPGQLDALHTSSLPATTTRTLDTDNGELLIQSHLQPCAIELIEIEAV